MQTGASWQQPQLNYLGEDAEVYVSKVAKVNVSRPEKGPVLSS